MRIYLSWRNRDVLDINSSSLGDVRVRVWKKQAAPKLSDDGPDLRAGGHLQSSERARSMEPDTTTFGFSRRNW